MNIERNVLSGVNSAIAVIFIWSTWLVVSRVGVQSNLTIFDLAAIRYGVSSIIALPFVLYYKPWKTLTLRKLIVLTLLLGPLYVFCVFAGFVYAPVAHGGIFLNGSLPAITLVMGLIIYKQKLSFNQAFGLGLIVLACVFALLDLSAVVNFYTWRGDLLFFLSAIFFSGYLLVARNWNLSLIEILFCSSVINCIIYLPIWFLFLPKGALDVTSNQLALQIFYQGIIPNVVGLLLVANAAKNIGSAATAAFLAAVPSLSSLLGVVFLQEVLGILGWLSVILITPGILMVAFSQKNVES